MLARGRPTWRHGDDLDAFVARAQRLPLRAGGATLFSAHQMGTCRMGGDPATSVADPRGELHDTKGVWIGDASAFPTPSGTNPMITIMALALADRVAHRRVDRCPGPAQAGASGMTSVQIATDRLFIGGEWVDARRLRHHRRRRRRAPRRSSAASPRARADDVDRAVAAARAAFDGWAATPPAERVELCTAVSLRLQERGRRDRRAHRPGDGLADAASRSPSRSACRP